MILRRLAFGLFVRNQCRLRNSITSGQNPVGRESHAIPDFGDSRRYPETALSSLSRIGLRRSGRSPPGRLPVYSAPNVRWGTEPYVREADDPLRVASVARLREAGHVP